MELKEAHKLFLKAIQDQRRFQRWVRKFPHNRVIRHREHTVVDGQKITRVVSETPQPEPRHPDIPEYVREGEFGLRTLYSVVLEQYQRARRPVATAEEVKPLELPAQYKEWAEVLREFYATK